MNLMRIFLLVAGPVMFWPLVASCGGGSPVSPVDAGTGDDGSDDGAAARAVLDKFCNTLADAYCEAAFACCGPPFLDPDAVSVDDCKSSWFASVWGPGVCNPQPSSTRPAVEAMLRAGTTVFDEAQFEACVTLLKSMSAGGSACVAYPGTILHRTCMRPFQAQLAPGDACTWEYLTFPCKEGRCEKGKCVAFLKTGDPCDVDLRDLGAPAATICNDPHNGEVCRGARGTEGTGGSGSDGRLLGTCGPQGELGDACHPGNNRECKSGHCDATGRCAPPDLQEYPCKVGD
jgi:hypothetical protein